MSMIEDDKLIRVTPVYCGDCQTGVRRDCIITKEEFLECYNEWVLKPLQENPVSVQSEFCIPVDNGGVTPV